MIKQKTLCSSLHKLPDKKNAKMGFITRKKNEVKYQKDENKTIFQHLRLSSGAKVY